MVLGAVDWRDYLTEILALGSFVGLGIGIVVAVWKIKPLRNLIAALLQLGFEHLIAPFEERTKERQDATNERIDKVEGDLIEFDKRNTDQHNEGREEARARWDEHHGVHLQIAEDLGELKGTTDALLKNQQDTLPTVVNTARDAAIAAAQEAVERLAED